MREHALLFKSVCTSSNFSEKVGLRLNRLDDVFGMKDIISMNILDMKRLNPA